MTEIQKNVYVLNNRSVEYILTVMRNKETPDPVFRQYANRLHRILVEEALTYLPSESVDIQTPCGPYTGKQISTDKILAVSIIRAGDSLLQSVLDLIPNVKIGKILIQRDEKSEDKRPILFYSKLPKNIDDYVCIICDPMLATGGSVCMACKELIAKGIKEENIYFFNVISCPEGVERVMKEYPNITIVTATFDKCLNDQKYIVPGLGDYGDRYFNTN